MFLALKYLLERVQHSHRDNGAYAYCIYDQNRQIEDRLHSEAGSLISEGSHISYFSHYYGDVVDAHMDLSNILELSLGNSRYSLGLQVADFFATFAYQYYKKGKPENCIWWETILDSLQEKEGKVHGYGLKEWP